MNKSMAVFLAAICLFAKVVGGQGIAEAVKSPPIGQPGRTARYRHDVASNLLGSMVKTFALTCGPIEERAGRGYQWFDLEATKANGDRFRVWLLSTGYPSPTLQTSQRMIARYILQEGTAEPTEFRNRANGEAVLPSLGGWRHLLPHPPLANDPAAELFPDEVRYLGNGYRREAVETATRVARPPSARVLELLPDVLIGVPSNTRQKDETRRYDGSDYELRPLAQEDFHEMVEAGINCLRVDARQLPWMAGLNAFYWGLGASEVPYPECLYRSTYLGPALFLDEPAVGTRDYVIRPRFAKDESFRKSLTPQIVFEAFQEHFRQAWQEGAPAALIKGLAGRPGVALGDMNFLQENLFTWETVESSAAYQLSQDPHVPAAMVWEPPGRVGTFRTLPELDMTYGCQLPVDDPKNLTDIIYGFLRGAARLTDKDWGMSIYGSVDRSDAFWFLTHAYDLGATRFFFWDNAKQACVPYHECLALARNLSAHAASFPGRDLPRLKRAAEVVILLPPGYNLGHVALGKGSLWGLGELNLERLNAKGVKYRIVMSNFFTEIERCLRLGIAFDLLWDLPRIQVSGYREAIHIREDGKVEVVGDGKRHVLARARPPARPSGIPPQLDIRLSAKEGKAPLEITAHATVVEKSAPVFYTLGADNQGVYRNAVVAWEIYGPSEADYRFLQSSGSKPEIMRTNGALQVVATFTLKQQGKYRLRAATVDVAGRTTITWSPIAVTQ
jgi:hypothetical protein